ncbi:hypothetical protein Back11_33880 [Paenibacillus baekrokdamisoli]|uniref:Uncharacterized protein n=1 Tax=Paenibacillus baekrokdamisoli TaxID=1712516 RepID=A0A3G9JAW4_9BACL|nr:response regulator [Paenibacillus baekrokdamisoli]MBB3073370.1 two-component system response regulator YesN [Paenibacillus baekrokdamisoli]BBH22043.1 hypothetical protein Back11_33880 [Paenibacillus baekrokdamisoli]
MLKILVVDDEYLVRMGICQTIDWAEHGVQIIGQASNGEEGLELALLHKPDVIITDVRMPYMNGLEFIAKVKENKLHAGIIVLSGYDEFQYAQTAMQHGASTYLLKPVDIEKLAESVREIGHEVRERQSNTVRLERLNKEVGAIIHQFWLDLLFGSFPESEEIEEKARMLNLAWEEAESLTVTVISLKKLEESSPIDTLNFQQRIIAEQLEAYSIIPLALIRTMPEQWAIVSRLREEEGASLALIRSFGTQLVQASKGQSAYTLSVGIGTPAGNWENIHASYESASLAALRASSGMDSVLYADEQSEAKYRREIRAALAYIRTHYANNVTVEMVAADVYVSPTHLMHLFRKELNKTFSECLTEYRIEVAKQMLHNPKYRVYEVGSLVGFGDSKYFSQVFKKMTGMPPSEYAKKR